MKPKYNCWYCGAGFDQEEYDEALEKGCPDCFHKIKVQPKICFNSTCRTEIDEDDVFCPDCLKDRSVNSRIDDARNEEISNSF